MAKKPIVTKDVIRAVKSIYRVYEDTDGVITYSGNFDMCSTTLKLGEPYEFEVNFNTNSHYGERLLEKDFKQMSIFLSFLDGVFATMEVLNDEDI